ncbi:hypothetical protein FHETE_6445 [Fusarium heterosporum]|uniref:Uncharacterized protein n=1 Tax=Fusarium heterosporum TaxID=42747 RepID=A0A8H5TAC4_FUSHE|nr:hypothetical protein FHETE_6445 [Fusarium heterosporum]
MKPISETTQQSLPYTESDNSGRDARPGRNTTASSLSCHSDPFVKSGIDIDDGVQLRDFSSPGPIKTRSRTPDPNRFVAERPSRLMSNGGTELSVPRTNNLSSEDQTFSEWETVAADDTFERFPEAPARSLRRQRNFNFGNNVRETIPTNQNLWAAETHNFELVSQPSPSLHQCAQTTPKASPCLRSFHSSSSLYSDWGKHKVLNRGKDANAQGNTRSHPCPPEIFILPNDRAQETPKRYSHASSDSNEDPFKYDGDAYSGFLRPSAEKDVSEALHRAGAAVSSKESIPRSVNGNIPFASQREIKVPVRREENKASRRAAVPDRRLASQIASLVKNRPPTVTDGDWQTVTTEHPFNSMQQGFHDSIAKGTGSSVADVSDGTGRDPHPHSYNSTDKIIRHPHGNNNCSSHRIRHDRGTHLPISIPRYGGGPGNYAYNTTRDLFQPMSKPPESTARFSNLFRKEPTEPTYDREGILLSDLPPKRGSYQSLDSDAVPHESCGIAEETSPDGRKYFSWSRIRENLGRDPPKTPLTIFDQPLYSHGFQESANPNKPAHVPHDEFLTKLPRLPFPLVSLPEAQMLQRFKRQRGEEDHTQNASDFVARGRSYTLSTANSPCLPKTPPPPQRSFWATSPGSEVTRPAPAHYRQRLRQVFRRHDSSERISHILVSSSAILDTPPPTDPKSSTQRVWYRAPQTEVSTPRTIWPEAHDFFSGAENAHAGRYLSGWETPIERPFTRAETRLIEEAREDMLRHRQHADMVAERGKRVFMWIMILTLFFPFIGPIALYGKLNSTISWYTHGEMQCLTRDQHGTLKQQLIVEAVIYPALIISLSVYYSVHK